jgi:hypothetical protein
MSKRVVHNLRDYKMEEFPTTFIQLIEPDPSLLFDVPIIHESPATSESVST